MKCNCQYCQNEKYDSSDFFVDMSFLAKERPIGVSGLLRVKNEEDFLSQCIDSCIDALDELVIAYQPSDDNTPQIIEAKRQQYPNKIKVYFYQPKVLSHNLTHEEFEYAQSLPNSSIHLLSNYYNYTLSKATYRYVVKIDADQIYFPEKLQTICDAYRNQQPQRITLFERAAYWSVFFYNKLSAHFPRLFPLSLWIHSLPKKVVSTYEQYALKNIGNHKKMLVVSGINLFHDSLGWSVCLGGYKNVLPPFNGVGDTLFFELSPETYFIPFKLPHAGADGRYAFSYIEILKKPTQRMLYGGFIWYHLAALRSQLREKNKTLYKGRTAPLESFLSQPLSTWKFSGLFRVMEPYYIAFFESEKKQIPIEILPKNI